MASHHLPQKCESTNFSIDPKSAMICSFKPKTSTNFSMLSIFMKRSEYTLKNMFESSTSYFRFPLLRYSFASTSW